MPTKPSTTFTFATDANYSSGPATGFPTKIIPVSLLQGFVPGTGVNGEHTDYLHNITGDWITTWIDLGTFAPDEDAHIVETDTDGLMSVALCEFGGSAGAGLLQPTVTVSEPSGSGASLSVTYAAGTARAVQVVQSSAGSAASAVSLDNTDGTGAVLEVESSGSNTGPAILVTGNTAPAIEVTGGTARGVVITTTDAEPAPLQLVGRNLPGGPALGDIYVDDTADQERLRVYHEGAFQSAWTTPSGFARAFDTDRTESSTAAGGFTPKVTAVFVAGDGLVSGATVHVRATCEIGQGAIGTALGLRLRDLTAAADVIGLEPQSANVVSAAADERYVVMEADYTLPASGARSISLDFESTGGGTTVYIRRASIEVTGQY